MSAAADIIARYNALWSRIENATSLAAGEAALAEWKASADYAPHPSYGDENGKRIYVLQAGWLGDWMKTMGYPWPRDYDSAKVFESRYMIPAGASAVRRAEMLEYGIRRELPDWLARAQAMWTNRKADLAIAETRNVAQVVETVTEAVQTLSEDVTSLTDVTAYIAAKVEMTPEERAEVVASLQSIRASREAARSQILSSLTKIRSIVTRLDQGIIPGDAVTPEKTSGGAVIAIGAAAVAAWLALR